MPLDLAAATRHLSRADPVMRKIVKSIGPCELKPGARGNHFTTLLRAIVGQQLSTRAAETIWQRVLELDGSGKQLKPETVLALSDAQLRGAGLSNAKVAYAKDLAARTSELRLNRLSRLDDEAIVELLTSVNGIGRWTVEMFLIFKLGRPDVWPVGDLGIRNAVARAYGLEPTKDGLQTVAAPWRPWRSIASWYLWRTLEPDPARAGPSKQPV
ncbi:MAG TPA: DNA-3-methyladenine glycosylase [Actinomycetota bacterium]|jgi:3-methyladenine DNA glycosylase/8-oxoguanine DNA glycosylase|nr:DNA-3-methyladenine glycosylase [Actinomycetota bacterium]